MPCHCEARSAVAIQEPQSQAVPARGLCNAAPPTGRSDRTDMTSSNAGRNA